MLWFFDPREKYRQYFDRAGFANVLHKDLLAKDKDLSQPFILNILTVTTTETKLRSYEDPPKLST